MSEASARIVWGKMKQRLTGAPLVKQESDIVSLFFMFPSLLLSHSVAGKSRSRGLAEWRRGAKGAERMTLGHTIALSPTLSPPVLATYVG